MLVSRKCTLCGAIAAAALLVAMCVLWRDVRTWGGVSTNTGRDKARLYVPPEALDFGDAWLQKEFVWCLPLRNATGRDIYITKFRTSCNCSVVAPESLIVPAHGTGTVRLQIDLTYGNGFRFARRFQSGIVASTLDAEPSVYHWVLSGRIKSMVALSEPVIEFEQPVIRGDLFPIRTVSLTCDQDVTQVSAVFDQEFIGIVLRPLDRGSQTYSLDVRPLPTLPAGQHVSLINLNLTTRSGQAIPAVPLTVKFKVGEDVAMIPPYVALGPRVLGERVQETVLLRSSRGQQFTVLNVTYDQQDVTVEELSRPASVSGRLYLLRARVSRSGTTTIPVRFAVQQNDHSRPYELLLNLTYYGRESCGPVCIK